MPMYSYECKECKHRTEKVVPYEKRKEPEYCPKCPECGGDTRHVFDFKGNIYIPWFSNE